MYRKIENRDKGNESVETKGSEGGVYFPGVDEIRLGGRAGEEAEMLSSNVSETLGAWIWDLGKRPFVKLCR